MAICTFNTQQQAIAGDYVFIPAQTIEYVKRNGNVLGKIQRVDVSGSARFGYAFQLGAFAKDTDGGWRLLGAFGQSVDVFITSEINRGGGKGAVYCNVMHRPAFEAALEAARAAVLGVVQ